MGTDKDVTSVSGYAGSKNYFGEQHAVCYHNPKNFSDYGMLGHAEVVQIHIPQESVAAAFGVYFSRFISLDNNSWDRPDYFDQGAEYRSLLGFPGGLKNSALMSALKQANTHNMKLHAGSGSDADTFGKNEILIM